VVAYLYWVTLMPETTKAALCTRAKNARRQLRFAPDHRQGVFRLVQANGVPLLCRDQPQGKHPDPFRPGCPENDEDGDGIPDADDPCPVTAPGATADPNRAGCPFTDSDNDGVGDSEDACPGKPGVFSPDPTHSGCPGKKERAAPSEGEAPPPSSEPFEAPSPVKKRRVK